MLTGPVTMLQWSFVRDDQPRSETCNQLALAIRDEVADLEAAGHRRSSRSTSRRSARACRCARDRWDEYLDWAVDSFRLATAVVRDETQIHTHMCYSEFGDIMEQIEAMDADVLLIEAARSRMELLDDWERTGYAQRDRPGRLRHPLAAGPAAEEMAELLARPRQRAAARAALGQPRLRPEDPRLGGGRAVPAQHGRRPPSSCAKSSSRPA